MAALVALALILNLIDRALGTIMPLAPNAKIGLGNVITLLAIIFFGYKDAGIILVIRCVLGVFFGGGFFGIVYSLCGGTAAFIVMALMYRFLLGKISIIAVSISGAVVHNVVQVFIASLVVQQINYFVLLPFFLVVSVLAGAIVGFAAYFAAKYIPDSVFTGASSKPPKSVDGNKTPLSGGGAATEVLEGSGEERTEPLESGETASGQSADENKEI